MCIRDSHFRVEQYGKLEMSENKIVVVVHPEQYIPYDIRQRFTHYTLSYASLFPRLNAAALKNNKSLNLDLLAMAYKECFADLTVSQLTEQFIKRNVYEMCIRDSQYGQAHTPSIYNCWTASIYFNTQQLCGKQIVP